MFQLFFSGEPHSLYFGIIPNFAKQVLIHTVLNTDIFDDFLRMRYRFIRPSVVAHDRVWITEKNAQVGRLSTSEELAMLKPSFPDRLRESEVGPLWIGLQATWMDGAKMILKHGGGDPSLETQSVRVSPLGQRIRSTLAAEE
jgi:hypothetical protein